MSWSWLIIVFALGVVVGNDNLREKSIRFIRNLVKWLQEYRSKNKKGD